MNSLFAECSIIAFGFTSLALLVMLFVIIFLERYQISAWKNRKNYELIFSANFQTVSGEIYVICEHIPEQIRDILKPFQKWKHRIIFLKFFLKLLQQLKRGSVLVDVSTQYHAAVKEYKLRQGELREGECDSCYVITII